MNAAAGMAAIEGAGAAVGTAEVSGRHYRTGEPVAVCIENGTIVSVRPLTDAPAGADGRELPWIGPGLVDLQINGCAGFDFNTIPMADGTAQRITEALFREGVTAYYPTVITNSDEAIAEGMRTIAAACDTDPACRAAIAGIHLEGPFISPEDGARGAHSKAYVKAPDWELFQRWQESAGGRIRIVTLSPEWPEAPAFIERCVAHGVRVSIGHTAATSEQVKAAVRAGATMSTHLGNGAHRLLPRHPNYIWDQLAEDGLASCLIADGFHLPDAFLKVALRVKGERAILVSDAVSFSGMPPGMYNSHIGGQVVLTPEGKLYMAGEPRLLAGSAQLLPRGIANIARKGLASLAAAWEMASVHPSERMGLPSARGLAPGAPADLVRFRWDGQRVRIVETYKSGVKVYDSVTGEGK